MSEHPTIKVLGYNVACDLPPLLPEAQGRICAEMQAAVESIALAMLCGYAVKIANTADGVRVTPINPVSMYR